MTTAKSKVSAKKTSATRTKAKTKTAVNIEKVIKEIEETTEVKTGELKDSFERPYTIEEISITDINSYDSPSQIPQRYDTAAIEEYAALMRNEQWDWERFESFPVLFREEIPLIDEHADEIGVKVNLYIGDGHHTLDAAFSCERETVKCRVYAGSLTDAKAYSFREANRYHGVRLNNSQKRGIVIETITDPFLIERICQTVEGHRVDDVPSDRLIYTFLKGVVSCPTISDIWEKLRQEPGSAHQFPWLHATTRLGQDGKRQRVKVPARIVPTLPEAEEVEIKPVEIEPTEPIATIAPTASDLVEPIAPTEPTEPIVPTEPTEPTPTVSQIPVEGDQSETKVEASEDAVSPFLPEIKDTEIAEIADRFSVEISVSLSNWNVDPIAMSDALNKAIVKAIKNERDKDRHEEF